MELKKIWTSVTYEEPIILIIKADHSFLYLRSLKVPKIWLHLWKIHLQQLVVVHRAVVDGLGPRRSPWTRLHRGGPWTGSPCFVFMSSNVELPRGYSWELLVGVCRPVPQILTLFQTKKNDIFHTRFQTRPLKSIPVFRYGLQAEIMSSLLRLGRKQKNPFRNRIFLFLSYVYSFGIDTINTFMHPRSSFENHTWFQTKMGKNPARWGVTYLYSLYKGVTPPL